jgi:hypothetical protein
MEVGTAVRFTDSSAVVVESVEEHYDGDDTNEGLHVGTSEINCLKYWSSYACLFP